jgi:hypothetical protein
MVNFAAVLRGVDYENPSACLSENSHGKFKVKDAPWEHVLIIGTKDGS